MIANSKRTLLLRISDTGEPVTSTAYGQGVLTLPSLPVPETAGTGDPLFTVRLLIPAGSPVARDGLIWTNCPPDHTIPFERAKFHKKVMRSSFHRDDYVDLHVFRPGSYCFYFSFRNDKDQLETTRKFYFVAPPTLSINGQFLQLNSIALESVVSKWMGKDLAAWDRVLDRIHKKRYNMIHFTPLQHRGESNSPYSIYDQLEYDPTFFKSPEEVAQLVRHIHKDYQMLSLTDIVFNHTANNSEWLREHPEAGYNRFTAPHLTAAIELDRELLHFSATMKNLGYPTVLNSLDDLLKILDGVKVHVLGSMKLWEFYVLNVQEHLEAVEKQWDQVDLRSLPDSTSMAITLSGTTVKKDHFRDIAKYVVDTITDSSFSTLGPRFAKKLDTVKFIEILKTVYGAGEFTPAIKEAVHRILDEINLPFYREYDADVSAILEALYNRTKYLRLDEHGPKLGEVTLTNPLFEPYFTRFVGYDGVEYALANNGWIWGGNPLVDFASSDSKAYLRRDVIVWGDCVKLRYGSGPQDSPYLWERMSKYIEMNAKIFDGFRIDNCHSTPLHVGEYFLDHARKFNPNLYVVAELFTGSEQLDCLFVERLGISSLIREAMQAWSEEELSRLVHKHGGRPIGSYKFVPMDNFAFPADIELDEEFTTYNPQEHSLKSVSEIMIPRVLTAIPPHALFMDCTHDNETPYQRRTVEDTLPNAALVALCSSAIGSVYGYDEIFPHLLDLVNEKRHYATEGCDGIASIKTRLNAIRDQLNTMSHEIEDAEMHVHHAGEYITFHRVNAPTGTGWFLIARTKFSNSVDPNETLEPVIIGQTHCSLEFAYSLEMVGTVKDSEDTEYLRGIPTRLKELDGFEVTYDETLHASRIAITGDFPPGSIAIFKTQQDGVDPSLDHFIRSGALKATRNVTLESLNYLLYRCAAEELDSSSGKFSTYNIPNMGDLVYCGLQGWVSVLRNIIFINDLAHPLSENLRSGTWALDYVINRLDSYRNEPGIAEVQEWLVSRLGRVKQLPSYLRPSYFALAIGILYGCCRLRAMQLMSENIGKATCFVQSLGMTSIQMISKLNSTSLVPFEQVPAMAAGLPFFSTSYMRCWGRDVFISFRGLLLATGRFDEAKSHILAFASTLKHGLIPNLLDAGRNPRYNARDAVWFFLQAIQDYIKIVPDGEDILKEQVKRRFPLDDTWVAYDDPRAFSYTTSVEDIIYEILSRHARGIQYREANAGPNLDRVMRDEGFNVEIHVDWSTGLVHGGSQSNCGTWMDKMGESEKAGSFGIPGTPRDGAAVEINGLLKSALRFVTELNKKGMFKYTEVPRNNSGETITFEAWNNLLQENFERKFYVPVDPQDDAKFDIDPTIVNRRGIYKDLYRSGKPFEDYQLRPNFAVAMAVAPELFTPEYAVHAVNMADEIIRGPVGMRTLDPSDYNYHPYYNNSEDSDNFATSKGRNYHQGPEWVWCTGYFLRAFVYFHFLTNARACDESKTRPSSYMYQQLYRRLEKHREWIMDSPWAGLPELTNKDAEVCNDSSATQAWSSGCILDLFLDLWSAYEDDSVWD